MSFCGLDFGTTNSTLASKAEKGVVLQPLEGNSVTLPTSIFYHFEEDETFYGRAALQEYVDGEFGRLMRSVKSVLGTSLMTHKVQIKAQELSFVHIISGFLGFMKNKVELQTGVSLNDVVLGRPVYFVDGNKQADQTAQNALEEAAKIAGFKNVSFQLEPIAAALNYEQSVQKEELVLIVDLGGGTSDFSVVKLYPEGAKVADRRDDILANDGVHIGGTDFDKHLSLHSIMPELGYRSPFKDNPAQEMPVVFHQDLATWHKIHFLYQKDFLIDLRRMLPQMLERKKVGRLLKVVEEKEGHRLAMDVEKGKIKLSEHNSTLLNLDYVERSLNIAISQKCMNKALIEDVQKITLKALETIRNADVQPSDISTIFMTGGSTSIPLVRQAIRQAFPSANMVDGDKFGSVGLGLGLEAERRFG